MRCGAVRCGVVWCGVVMCDDVWRRRRKRKRRRDTEKCVLREKEPHPLIMRKTIAEFHEGPECSTDPLWVPQPGVSRCTFGGRATNMLNTHLFSRRTHMFHRPPWVPKPRVLRCTIEGHPNIMSTIRRILRGARMSHRCPRGRPLPR